MDDVVTETVLTCPQCGHGTAMAMPTTACQYFLDCPACGAVITPRSGDCCVFCSYASHACPPVQRKGHC